MQYAIFGARRGKKREVHSENAVSGMHLSHNSALCAGWMEKKRHQGRSVGHHNPLIFPMFLQKT